MAFVEISHDSILQHEPSQWIWPLFPCFICTISSSTFFSLTQGFPTCDTVYKAGFSPLFFYRHLSCLPDRYRFSLQQNINAIYYSSNIQYVKSNCHHCSYLVNLYTAQVAASTRPQVAAVTQAKQATVAASTQAKQSKTAAQPLKDADSNSPTNSRQSYGMWYFSVVFTEYNGFF